KCDSLDAMNAPATRKDKFITLFALGWLLLLGSLALAGPYGLLSWSEQASLLQDRNARIASLEEDQAVLENRVDLL
ncbi:MAG: hypothetical protein GWM87_11120, partial [Xanthomonadales bacterium]|nr:hypothetical protein [Xanthomonadales bacterium]NIX13427.1 hypothetical protein [Xanthomonadales bacterium]